MHELGGRCCLGVFFWLASMCTSPGVLNGCDTPGVADDTAEGTEMSSVTGCRGAGGGGVADTVALPSLYDRTWYWYRWRGNWRAPDHDTAVCGCCRRERMPVRHRWQIILSVDRYVDGIPEIGNRRDVGVRGGIQWEKGGTDRTMRLCGGRVGGIGGMNLMPSRRMGHVTRSDVYRLYKIWCPGLFTCKRHHAGEFLRDDPV